MTRLTDRHGTKIPSSARGPWRSLWVARSGPAASTYKAYGKELHLLAMVLTDDTELAQELVVQAIMTYGLGPSSLQELSSGVYVAWIGWGSPALSGEPAGRSTRAQMLHEIHGLPADQRAALGLCRYGGHTYRRAADVLGLAPELVARLLQDALSSLATPRILRLRPSPAA